LRIEVLNVSLEIVEKQRFFIFKISITHIIYRLYD